MPLRPCALLALSSTCVFVTSGCPSRQLARVPIEADVVEKTNLPLDENRDMDILFVIDNSRSMLQEQDSLAANFPAIIDELRSAPNQPSVHIGVISTDVGGGEICPGTGDEGALQTGDADCNAINDGRSFITDIVNEDGSRQTNYDGELRDAFSCMAKLGTDGCGFEQPLEAVKQAVENPANAGFFRDNAYLAIIFVTDEDDCSIKDPTMLDDDGDRTAAAIGKPLGPASSFRCFEFGVQCQRDGDVRDEGLQTDCIPQEDSPYMQDVASYITSIRGAKRFPTQIFTAAIAGDLEPVEVEYRTTPVFPTVEIPLLAYSCDETGLGEAVPPVRLNAFLGAFEGRSVRTTLCQPDLTGAVQQIAEFFRDILGPPCVQGELADISDDPGLQPDCSIVEVTDPGLGTESQRVLEACDNPGDPAASSTLPCFHMFEDPTNCSHQPSQLAVEIVYADGFTVAPFTQAEVSCVGVEP